MAFKQISRKSALSFIVHISYSFFGIISLLFVKHFLGYEAVGILAFAISFVSMFAIIGDMGFNTAHLKKSNEGLNLPQCNGTIVTIKTFLTFLMLVSILTFIFIQKYILGIEFESKELEIVIAIIILQHLILNMSGVFRIVFAAKLEVAKSQIPRFVSRFSAMVLKVVFVLSGFGVIYLAFAELFASVLVLTMAIYLIWNYPFQKPNKKMIKAYSKFALPMVFISFVASYTHNLDKVMLGFFWDSTEVGVYTIPQRTLVALSYISTTITTMLFVVFSDLYAKKDFEEIKRLTNKSEKIISLLVMPITIFLVLCADSFIRIFGSDTSASVPVLQFLALGTYISSVMYPYSIQVISTGHLRIATGISVLFLVMTTSLNLLFIPEEFYGINLLGLGAKGAAFATLISLSIQALLFRFIAYKLTKSTPNIRIFIHIIAGLLTFYVVYLLYVYLSLQWIYFAIYIPIIAVVFYLLMYFFGELTKSDIKLFLNAINISKMSTYIKEELKS